MMSASKYLSILGFLIALLWSSLVEGAASFPLAFVTRAKPTAEKARFNSQQQQQQQQRILDIHTPIVMEDDKQLGAASSSSAWLAIPFAVATCCLSTFGLPPPVVNAAEGAPPVIPLENVAKGQQLFQANCAGCHAGGQNFINEKKTLQKEALERYRSTDKDQLQAFVQNGMPHKMLPLNFEESDYSDVVSYVLDQALNNKW